MDHQNQMKTDEQLRDEAAAALRKKKKLKRTEQFIDPYTDLACKERTEGDRLEEGVKYGWDAARQTPSPEEVGLYEAAKAYLKLAPVDGWHFSDCDAADGIHENDMPCSCGVGAKEFSLTEALAAYEAKRSQK